MASDFAAYATVDRDLSRVLEFTPGAPTNDLIVGSLAVYTSAEARLCGADPASILGLSEVVSEKAKLITPNGKVPILVLNPGTVVAMCSATTYDEATHRGTAYGVVKLASGNWAVDTSDTSATRVVVVGGLTDNNQNIFFVRFLAANLQFDAIAS